MEVVSTDSRILLAEIASAFCFFVGSLVASDCLDPLVVDDSDLEKVITGLTLVIGMGLGGYDLVFGD